MAVSCRMLRSRKGIFYSVMAILLLGFLVYGLSISTKYSYTQEMFVAKTRIKAMNTFIEDLERDLHRAVFIISFRSLLAMQQQILNEGTFFADSETTFNESFINGTIDGQEVELMNQSNFLNWTSRIAAQASRLGMDLDLEIQTVSITQESPWRVDVDLTVQVNLTDDIGSASWLFNKTISESVTILDLEDPLYIVNTAGKVTNTFRRSPYEGNFTDGGDTTQLKAHINASYYMASASAPDYLMRLEGNLSNSSAGVESMVYLPSLSDAGITIEDRSAIDYIYFGEDNLTNATFKVNDTYTSWFRLDNTSGHLGSYQVENLTFT